MAEHREFGTNERRSGCDTLSTKWPPSPSSSTNRPPPTQLRLSSKHKNTEKISKYEVKIGLSAGLIVPEILDPFFYAEAAYTPIKNGGSNAAITKSKPSHVPSKHGA